ncbi:DUF1906 domain-containing protein [Actinomadura atramentaria]|uniref:DUF1906 domain-containing protein n=1 Tax=Actinomadura atramentaria TaxID=1990 RepID=UPI0003AA5DE2|nr:DUF1906 domain-containing protein [Actinomadura atramentaria]
MRNAKRRGAIGGTLGLAAAVVVPGLGPSAAGAAPHPAAALSGPAVVAYRGARIAVPAGWAVHRLDGRRCVRFDADAVYLGRAAADADCPARVIGGAAALRVEPLDDGRRRAGPVRADRLARYRLPAGGARVELPEAGVAVSGSGPGAQRAIRGIRLSAHWTGDDPDESTDDGTGDLDGLDDLGDAADRPASPDKPRPKLKKAKIHYRPGFAHGRAFDTCAAPSLRTMRAWRSAYRIANVYIGGVARGCAQPNLTRSWVRRVRALGYRLIPTYVGHQAPCAQFRTRFTPANAAKAGAWNAKNAVARARKLGIPARSPIYFDLEGYDSDDASCRAAAMKFLNAWTRGLRARHYVPGVYSSVGSGIRDLGRARGIAKPPIVWYAHWDGRTAVYDNPYLDRSWWPPHRRIKQYRGGHRETHGGVALNVDSNAVDGRVY